MQNYKGMKRLFILTMLIAPVWSFSQEDEPKMIIAEGVEIDSSGISPEAQEAYNAGVAAFEKDRFAEAIGFFTQAIDLAPDFDKAISNRAYCYLSKGDQENAKLDFLKLAEMGSDPGNAFFEIGLMYAGQDEEQAIVFYTKAIDAKSTDPRFHYRRGLSYFNLEKYELAKDDFTGAITLDGKFAHAYNERGSANRMLDKLDEAIKDYKAATMYDKDLVIAYNNLGSVYREKGEYESAIRAYSDGLGKDKNAFMVLNNRGYAKFEKGDFKGAIEDFKEVIKLKSDYAFAFNNMSAAYIKLEDYKNAVDAATKAIGIDNEFGYAYYNRGVAHEMLRNEVQACEDWMEASVFGVNLAESYFQTNSCSSIISEK